MSSPSWSWIFVNDTSTEVAAFLGVRNAVRRLFVVTCGIFTRYFSVAFLWPSSAWKTKGNVCGFHFMAFFCDFSVAFLWLFVTLALDTRNAYSSWKSLGCSEAQP